MSDQAARNIRLIFEVKMSIVNNYSYNSLTSDLKFVGDYKSHKGNPSILRSDSMLKAIGKSINMRVSGVESTKIPIVILGNSPITDSYKKKVDFLKQAGIIQGFISLYPNPTPSYIKETPDKGIPNIWRLFFTSKIYIRLSYVRYEFLFLYESVEKPHPCGFSTDAILN